MKGRAVQVYLAVKISQLVGSLAGKGCILDVLCLNESEQEGRMDAPNATAEGPLRASALGADPLASSLAGSGPLNPAGSALRTLIGQKEKELQDMNEYRIRALEGAIAERDRQVMELRENFKKLKVDFQYNLRLIEDRDAELERYDATFANMKNLLHDRDTEASDLKVSIDELEAQVRSERERTAQVEGLCQDKLAEAKARAEGLRLQKDEELRKTRADMDEMRRAFLAQLSEKDELLSTQRRDMSASFDNLAKRQEADAAAREEVLRGQLREAQGKDQRQLEEKVKLEQELDEQRRTAAAMNVQLQSKEADLADARSDAESRITRLKRDMEAMHTDASSAAEAAQARATELTDRLREAERNCQECTRHMAEMRESMQEEQRRALQDQEKTLRELLHDAETRCETLSSKLSASEAERDRFQQAASRSTREGQQQEMVHLEATQALQRKLDAAQTQLAELMRTSGVQRALLEEELAAAREKNTAMKRAQDERRQDLESLRGELQRASEREESLQRQLAQQSLAADGAARAEHVDGKMQESFSELLKSVGQQRDRAIAEKEDAQERLAEAEQQLTALKSSALRPAGLKVETLDTDTPLDSPIQMPPFPATPVPHNHNLSSRPTTADTDMWRSRPATAEGLRPGTAEGGGGTRPATAEGVREAAAGVEASVRPRTADTGVDAARASADARRLRVRLGEVEEQNDRLRAVVAQMREEMERLTSSKAAAGAAAVGNEHEDKEALAERLRQTEAVLRRVTAERDKLIAISNMLRADLKRAQTAAGAQDAGSPPSLHAGGREKQAPVLAAGTGDAALAGGRQGAGPRQAWAENGREDLRALEGGRWAASTDGEEGQAADAGGMEVVETAMAELVNRNRQLKFEFAAAPAVQKKTVRKDRERHLRTRNLEGGLHSHNQREGDVGACSWVGEGARRKVDKVRESLFLSGHSTAVKDRMQLIPNSDRMTDSQNKKQVAMTRVPMQAANVQVWVR